MKAFSRLNLFTIFCLSSLILLVGSQHVSAQDITYSLKVEGETERTLDIGEKVEITFSTTKQVGTGQVDSNTEAKLKITYHSTRLRDVRAEDGSHVLNRGTVDVNRLGTFTVTAIAKAKGDAYIQAEWEGLTARADLHIEPKGISPATIVVNPPNPKSPHSVGSTFTQRITIKNDGKEDPTLPLSAYQMDIVFNPFILEVVSVTEGTFLEKDGVDALWNINTGTGVINVVQARIGQASNPNPPPANVAKAPSPAGISLSAGEEGDLLAIKFRVLAVAEETLGIHNVRLQSSKDEDKDGTPDRISYAIKILDAFVTTHQQIFAKEDVNQDEYVNILDLVMVAANIGAYPWSPRTDVNGDGFVNVLDILLIYQSSNWGKKTGKTENEVNEPNDPPALAPLAKGNVDPAMIQGWIDLAQNEDDGSVIFDRGIANLKSILVSKKPTQTRLLRNYPNPFNPETWIPYQLEKAADVTVTIHSINGTPIRIIELGHQPAGLYQSKNRAVYWDGRNEFGEQAASGLYFYTLTADKFSATRKMLILK